MWLPLPLEANYRRVYIISLRVSIEIEADFFPSIHAIFADVSCQSDNLIKFQTMYFDTLLNKSRKSRFPVIINSTCLTNLPLYSAKMIFNYIFRYVHVRSVVANLF